MDEPNVVSGCGQRAGHLPTVDRTIPVTRQHETPSRISTGRCAEAERIMLHSRDGHKVYVRVVDPCDPEPKPVETYKGDELIMMEHISHISHHLMQEATRGTCSRNGNAAITSL